MWLWPPEPGCASHRVGPCPSSGDLRNTTCLCLCVGMPHSAYDPPPSPPRRPPPTQELALLEHLLGQQQQQEGIADMRLRPLLQMLEQQQGELPPHHRQAAPPRHPGCRYCRYCPYIRPHPLSRPPLPLRQACWVCRLIANFSFENTTAHGEKVPARANTFFRPWHRISGSPPCHCLALHLAAAHI